MIRIRLIEYKPWYISSTKIIGKVVFSQLVSNMHVPLNSTSVGILAENNNRQSGHFHIALINNTFTYIHVLYVQVQVGAPTCNNTHAVIMTVVKGKILA